MGPPQGDTTASPLLGNFAGPLNPNPTCVAIKNYIEGTVDAQGNALPINALGPVLRPDTIDPADYSIEAPSPVFVKVELQLTMSAAYAFPWTYNADAVLAFPIPTTTTFSIAGNHAALYAPGGSPVALLLHIVPVAGGAYNPNPPGFQAIRANYYAVTPTSVTFNGGTGNTDFVIPAFSDVVGNHIGPDSGAGAEIYPLPPNWAALRTAMFTIFDTAAPGDTSPASRWPRDGDINTFGTAHQGILKSIIQAAASAVPGVIGCTVVQPASDLTSPGAKAIYVLTDFIVHA
jgi:hypothetical protein